MPGKPYTAREKAAMTKKMAEKKKSPAWIKKAAAAQAKKGPQRKGYKKK